MIIIHAPAAAGVRPPSVSWSVAAERLGRAMQQAGWPSDQQARVTKIAAYLGLLLLLPLLPLLPLHEPRVRRARAAARLTTAREGPRARAGIDREMCCSAERSIASRWNNAE